MRIEAEIRVRMPKDLIEVTKHSLMPETTFPRTRVQVNSSEDELTLLFEAKDTSALRAVLNSYISWVQMVQEVYKRLNPLKYG